MLRGLNYPKKSDRINIYIEKNGGGISVPMSFAGMQAHINQVAKTKGLAEGKKAGKAYCEKWKKEMDLAKMNLMMEKEVLPPDEYNKKVADFNKQIAEMNMCIGAINKMSGK